MKKKATLGTALLPVIFLIGLLSINVLFVYEDDALAGSNQFILLLAGAFAALIGYLNGVSYKKMLKGIEKAVKSTTGAIFILLVIGSLAGSWMLSGIVPAMIYYGLQILNPSIFLVASALICAMVSLATGSSWSTTATVGIALIGIGEAMQMSSAMVAGAVISGAYFGDKISPLSDTTNLAPAMAGTDLFTHIRYMLYTTVPSFAIALLIFIGLGLSFDSTEAVSNVEPILNELNSTFHITPWLFLVPALVIFLIIKKVPALPAILIGTLAGGLFAIIFQKDLLITLNDGLALNNIDYYRIVMNAFTVDVSYPAEHPVLQSLLESSGMAGMLNTVWLILAAMTFGGVMEACGFLKVLSSSLLKVAKSTASLVATTAGTCLTLNITASDQYLAIVVPGRMYADAYRKRGLAPENLSRTLEDSGTVTSVLVPWNTCGAYQSGVLKVETLDYLPFAFFNLLSPVMTILFAAFNIKIRQLVKPVK
jgi:NhaC family Na+:H+ antiporter